jgi:nucleoredoxin
MEVVFVSSDRDDKSFGDYFAKMPWLAMVPAHTIGLQARQRKLMEMFKIQVR